MSKFFSALISIMVGFCFETWNILYKYFILIRTISKWQTPLLPIQIIIIHRYHPYCYLILDRYFPISLPCSMNNLIFLYPSSLQCMAHSNPLPVRRFNVAYCHRKLKVRLTEGAKYDIKHLASSVFLLRSRQRLGIHHSFILSVSFFALPIPVFNFFLPYAWRYLLSLSPASPARDTFSVMFWQIPNSIWTWYSHDSKTSDHV